MKTGYMCSIDYDEHLENDWHDVPVYTSVESIKHHRKCVAGKKTHCGIYKVQIERIEVMQEEWLYEH